MKKSGAAPTLDLHGYKMDEVFDAVEAFLRKHANASKVRIMHGKGTGAVRAKVLEYLRLAGYHSYTERLDSGKPNDGVLVVPME